MVSNTTSHPTPTPLQATHCLYKLYKVYIDFERGVENTNMTDCIFSLYTLWNIHKKINFGVFIVN